MTVKKALEWAYAKLKNAQDKNFRLDAEILLSDLLKRQKSELLLLQNENLNEKQQSDYKALIERRLLGEPVAFIVGKRGFWKDDFIVTPQVLIPRPETEHIIEELLKLFRNNDLGKDFNLLDMGTGSGCLAISIQKEFPNARVWAVDVSNDALKVAIANEKAILTKPKINWLEEDLLAPVHLKEKIGNDILFDVVVANPPYVAYDGPIEENVKKYEPNLALFSKENGYFHLSKWANLAYEHLNGDGYIIFEIGSTQGEGIIALLKNLNFKSIEVKKDYSGLDRVVLAKK